VHATKQDAKVLFYINPEQTFMYPTALWQKIECSKNENANMYV